MARRILEGVEDDGLSGVTGRRPHNLEERKNIKVKLPIRQHLRLQAWRLFGEDTVSSTVERALDLYFENLRRSEDLKRGAAGSALPDPPLAQGASPDPSVGDAASQR